MAKSKNFFGKRKGSTKSLTFSTLSINGNRTQITKDRVKYVKNPNTEAQQWQRAKAKATADMAGMYPELYRYFPPYTRNYSLSEIRDNPFYKINLSKNQGITEIYELNNTSILISDVACSHGNLERKNTFNFVPKENSPIPLYGIKTSFKSTEVNNLTDFYSCFYEMGFYPGDVLQFVTLFYSDQIGYAEACVHFTLGDKHAALGTFNNQRWIYKSNNLYDFRLGFFYDNYLCINLRWQAHSWMWSPVCACLIVSNAGNSTTSRMQINPYYVDAKILNKWEATKKQGNSNLYLNTGLDGVDINGGSTAAVVEAVNKANAAKANVAKEYRKKLENELLQNEMLEGNGLSDTIIQ